MWTAERVFMYLLLFVVVRFEYTDKDQWKRGAFPLESFEYYPSDPVEYKYIGIRKSPFVYVEAQENFEMRKYCRNVRNYKLTANRTADMLNARGFDVVYETEKNCVKLLNASDKKMNFLLVNSNCTPWYTQPATSQAPFSTREPVQLLQTSKRQGQMLYPAINNELT